MFNQEVYKSCVEKLTKIHQIDVLILLFFISKKNKFKIVYLQVLLGINVCMINNQLKIFYYLLEL